MMVVMILDRDLKKKKKKKKQKKADGQLAFVDFGRAQKRRRTTTNLHSFRNRAVLLWCWSSCPVGECR